MNVCVQVFSSWGIYLGVELLDHVLILFNFFRNSVFFLGKKTRTLKKSRVMELFYILAVLVLHKYMHLSKFIELNTKKSEFYFTVCKFKR